ncbi:Phosphotransferase enzyme family [Aspergillus sclerotialis]|uniref:Phosphotransferase enzyme family n=1 Tax=Aspergillus sclerotialis TaxID=2070753 RepID=A0A3A2Z9Q6_9EURO|nr:Phosphotransferase enzyme family [Aspergillus sclerotialis]
MYWMWLDARETNQCDYTNHVKLFYGASTRGVWSIGSDAILKDRPDEGPKAKIEVKTLNYLATHTEIPVDRDGRYFVLNKRVDGQTLEEAWPSLSEPQKVAIADQVVQVRKQFRSITSSSIQCIDGSPCYSSLLFFDHEPRGPFHSDQELWDALLHKLDHIPQQALENLKKLLPKCEPYVLTHCDLNLGNIMVQDGKVVSILDWEYAAYFPIWYEYVSASFGFTHMDVEWKRLLRERLGVHGEAFEDATAFWTDMWNLRKYPDLDEKGQETLRRLS